MRARRVLLASMVAVPALAVAGYVFAAGLLGQAKSATATPTWRGTPATPSRSRIRRGTSASRSRAPTPAPNRFGIPSFYALHAWVWKNNPSGTFQPWNPKVRCP